jgi:hypothetical protein
MDYVMSQLCIKFPKIKDNRYLYNVAESAVFKFNEDRQKEKSIKEFEEKFGKDSYILDNKKSKRNNKNDEDDKTINSNSINI